MQDLLAEGLSRLALPEKETLQRIMDTYISELRLFNSAYNLVNTDDRNEIIVRHILDSLAAAPYISRLAETKKNPVIADIGSGGGFPGIPLAAAFPQYNFVLVERMSKRCAFLENCIAILGLKNTTVKNTEAEHMPKAETDIAVFRAFRPLDAAILRTLLELLKPDGVIAAYKAKREKITAEMQSVSGIIPSFDIVPLSVPFLTGTGEKDRERNLVVIRKPQPHAVQPHS